MWVEQRRGGDRAVCVLSLLLSSMPLPRANQARCSLARPCSPSRMLPTPLMAFLTCPAPLAEFRVSLVVGLASRPRWTGAAGQGARCGRTKQQGLCASHAGLDLRQCEIVAKITAHLNLSRCQATQREEYVHHINPTLLLRKAFIIGL